MSPMRFGLLTLRGLGRSVLTTRNFWSAIALRILGGERRIVMRNGFAAPMSWLEYSAARELSRMGFALEAEGDAVVCRKGDVAIVGPLLSLAAMAVDFGTIYEADFGGKTVLDIGGCIGESAVYFARRGASRVIVYEPVPEHHRFIRLNCSRNAVNAELHEAGVGASDGTMTVHFDYITPGLGEDSTGGRTASFKVRNLADVIRTSGADIAKLNCEGGEKALLSVQEDVLRLVPLYLIEAHSVELRKSVLDKFVASGFEVVKDWQYCKDTGRGRTIHILTFRRIDRNDIGGAVEQTAPRQSTARPARRQ